MKKNNLTKRLVLIFALFAGIGYTGNYPDAGGGDDCDECGMCFPSSGSDAGCIEFWFSTGATKNQVNVRPGRLTVMSELPSPTVSTPQAIKVVSGMYGIQRVVSNKVDIVNDGGKKITFSFSPGSAEALPVEQHSTWHASLKRVDAQGVPTTNHPVFYDLYTFKGLERVRFDADTNSVNYLRMVNLRTEEGQVYESADFGMSYIYDEEGVIRQVMGPTRMLDVVTFDEFKYEVRFYDPQNVSSSVNTNGLYEPLTGAAPFETWTIKNPNGTNSIYEIHVSRTVGDTTRTRVFTYTEAQNTWAASYDGETFDQSTMEWDDARVNCVRTKSYYSFGEAPVSLQIKRLTKQSWGQALMEVEDMVSATNSRIRILDYYTDETQTGRYSRVKSIKEADESWLVHDYDESGRKTLTISSWKNMAMTSNAASAKAVYYDYTPHEDADVLLEFDERPRTVTETIEGIITKRTFYTYKTNSVGAQVHITEECASPAGEYGDAANQQTIKTFYAPYDGSDFQQRLNQGRLHTVETPDKQLKTYQYALGELSINATNPAVPSFTVNTNGLDWRVTVINGTVDDPEGSAGKSTMRVTVKDRFSNEVLSETYIYTGTGYERINWTVKKFDIHGNAVEAWFADGTRESGFWGTGCCGKDSETGRDGTELVFTHDQNERLISSSRLDTNGVAGFTSDTVYDAAGRRIGTSRYAPGITPLETQMIFDMIGRPLHQTLEDGTEKTWIYDDTSRTIYHTQPGGATVVTEMNLDGRVRRQTGTAKIHSAYDYGVNADGTQWRTEYTGPEGTNSPVWQKITADVLGRPVKIEKPGFDGSTLLTEMAYNSIGKVEKIVQLAVSGSTSNILQSAFYEYDALGDQIRTAVDLNANGQLDLTADRITEEETFYQQISNNWYRVTETRIYPEDGSSSVLITAVKRVRLTGLGSTFDLGLLTSEILSIDLFGNQTVQRRFTDRSNKTVTTITDIPDSDTDEVVVAINRMKAYEISKTGVRVDYQYDSLTRQIGSRSDSDNGNRAISSRINYNDKGQVAWREDEASNRIGFGYDPNTGLRVAATNALGYTTLYTYNLRGELTLVGGSSQYPVEYRYDDFGRRTDLYTLRGATNGWDRTQWLYDDATGLVTNKLYADGNGPSYTYTPEGKLATRIWARGITTTYSYDTIGQLTNTVYSDSTPSVPIAYNRLGQKTQVIDASGTNTFAYNSLLQLTNETQLASFDLSRSYDSLGRSTGLTLNPVDPVYHVKYSYDDVGRFSSVSSSVSSVSSVVNYSRLDGSSLISGYTTDTGLSVSYGFETNRNAKTQVLNEFGTNLVSRFDYTYDPLMRRTQRIDVRGQGAEVSTNDFSYNARSELLSAVMSTNEYDYAYDSIGNREWARMNANTNRYVANNLNQYSQITNNQSQITLSYDPDGNLLSDGVTTYFWNGENRLIAVEPASPTNGSKRLEFSYDCQGRRISKDVYEWDSSQGLWSKVESLSFIYDGWNLISAISTDLTTSTVSTNSYVWGLDLSQSRQGAGGIGGLLSVTALTNSTASTYLTAYDANGNITDYVTTNGTVAAHYEYDPYGNITHASGLKSQDFTFRFSTKYFDAEIGLSYYGYRYYSPILGRWLNRDPLGELGGLNLYVACRNNTVNSIDRLGLQSDGWEIYNDIIMGNDKNDDFDLGDILFGENDKANLDGSATTDLPAGAFDLDPDVEAVLDATTGALGFSLEFPFISLDIGDWILNLLEALWERENDPWYGCPK